MSANRNQLQAGVAVVDITPPVETQLAGGPFGLSQRVLHPLQAKGLALQQGEERLLLITGDLLGFDEDYATATRREIARTVKMSADAIMLAATHTHGGPAAVDLGEWGRPDPAYLKQLRAALVEVAARAWQALQPAQAGTGAVDCPGVGVNRTRSPQPEVNDRLSLIRVDDDAGNLRAVVLNYGCHPVNLHSTGSITPDYPHFIELGVPVLFTLGAAGDVNPANFGPERSEARAAETAGKIAAKALALLPQIKTSAEVALAFALRDVELPLQDGARKSHLLTLQTFRIGDAGLVGVPGEPFAVYGKAIARSGVLSVTFCVALANGCVGYFPSPDAYDRKAYEALEVPRRLGRQPFTPDCGARLTEAALGALRDLPHLARNTRSRHLWGRSCQAIVGGGQAHKRPVKYMYRGGPGFAMRAKGARFWDADGNEYLDYLLAYGPIILGYGDSDVNDAVRRQMEEGTLFSVEHPRVIELAEKLCKLIPCAEMVVPFIGGSAATAGALRCARAHTGREKIVRCGYHGWFDWCFPEVPGVPRSERDLILSVSYNDLPALQQLLEVNRGQVAGVIIEAVQNDGPSPDYFAGVRRLCDEHGVVFILDEVKTGFRFDLGGAQKPFGIDCDLATFGKAMCNGYPGSVVVGKRKVLEARTDTFLAATFHADLLSVAAALTVIRVLEERDGIAYMHRLGRRLIDGLNDVFRVHEFPCRVGGFAPMPALMETATGALKGKAMSAWCAAMQRRGIYVTGHVWFLSLAHTEDDIEQTIAAGAAAADEAWAALKE